MWKQSVLVDTSRLLISSFNNWQVGQPVTPNLISTQNIMLNLNLLAYFSYRAYLFLLKTSTASPNLANNEALEFCFVLA